MAEVTCHGHCFPCGADFDIVEHYEEVAGDKDATAANKKAAMSAGDKRVEAKLKAEHSRCAENYQKP